MSQSAALFKLALDRQALLFGDFTLKSGRQSPYFFNTGKLCDGESLALLGELYADRIMEAKVEFDVLFGPAYKGIPLVAATAIALQTKYQINAPWCFNRKEAKDHGEGGTLVGAALTGKVIVIDDIITAGTAIRESIEIIHANGASLAAVLVSMDRQERGHSNRSAIQEVEADFQVPVMAAAQLSTLIEFVQQDPALSQHLPAMQAYREQYGV